MHLDGVDQIDLSIVIKGHSCEDVKICTGKKKKINKQKQQKQQEQEKISAT